MRRPLSVVLARLPFKRPFLIGVAALLLVSLVGAAVWWQVGAHASPATLTVVSDTNDQYSMASGPSGHAVLTYGHVGCGAVDSNGICTTGGWTQVQPAMPGAHWIWPTQLWDPNTQGGNAMTFTKQFTIPASALNITGKIVIAADNFYVLQVNGQSVGRGMNWQSPDTYDLSPFLHPGANIITVKVANNPDDGDDPVGNPGGLIYRADMSFTSDSTAPTTTASLAGTTGSNGWYRGPVTVTLHATDSDDDSSTLLTNYSTDGGATWLAYDSNSPLSFANDGQYTVQYRSVDQAGNLEATHSVSFNIDQTSPVLNVSGAANQSYDVCSTDRPVRPTFAPADATSGLDGSQGDSWTTPNTATGAGVYTYTAHATDMAGNQASETRTYKVLYGAAYTGVLDPLKTDQTNSINLGATIPLKFQLLCNGTPITTAVVSLSVKPGTGTAATTKQPKKLSTTNEFTYDPTSQQYHLNVSTGAGYTNPDGSIMTFAAGTWTFTVTLDDGVSYDYTVQLS